MKKEYKAPIIKVRKIQCSYMLCGSEEVTINFGVSVSEEEGKYSDCSGYGEAW